MGQNHFPQLTNKSKLLTDVNVACLCYRAVINYLSRVYPTSQPMPAGFDSHLLDLVA